jgi:beta-lactamase superfamily II metal-dependent hydrolase
VNNICGYRAFITAVSQEPGVTYRSALNGSGQVSVPFKQATCYGKHLDAENIQLIHGPKISNETIQLGQGATMTFLHADGSDFGNQFNRNSLVVRLDLGGKRVLMMGDAEAGGRAFPTTMAKPDSIEGKLLACCRAEIRADVIVAGHHGSMTSSRKVFFDAVQAEIFVVSAGPTKYATVVLPDKSVIDELTSRGRLFRTDLDDDACATQQAKIGPDNDGKAGGCDNIRISITSGTGQISADYWRSSD